MTQGQFLSVQLFWMMNFAFSYTGCLTSAKESSLLYCLPGNFPNLIAYNSYLFIKYYSFNRKAHKFNLEIWNALFLQDNDTTPEPEMALISLKLQKHNLVISAVCETHLAGSLQLAKLKKNPCLSGVDFFIKFTLAESVFFLQEGISDCIMAFTLDLDNYSSVTLVSYYTSNHVATWKGWSSLPITYFHLLYPT